MGKKEQESPQASGQMSLTPIPPASSSMPAVTGPWTMVTRAGIRLKIPAYVTRELLEEQRIASGSSPEEWELFLTEAYEETAGVRRPYPVLNVIHDPNEDHVFGLRLGLLSAKDLKPGEMEKRIRMGAALYAIVVQGTTVANCYGNELGDFTGDAKVDKLRCLAMAPMVLPNRGGSRPIEPSVIYETIWDGERGTCAGCPKNVFAGRDCKETLSIMSMLYSPEVEVEEMREIHPSGKYFPVMLRLSPKSIGRYSGRSMRKDKAGWVTIVGAKRLPLIFSVARLGLEAQHNDAQQKWGVIAWNLVTDPAELAAIGYPVLQAMALQFRKDLRDDASLMKLTMKEYAKGEAPRASADDSANDDVGENEGAAEQIAASEAGLRREEEVREEQARIREELGHGGGAGENVVQKTSFGSQKVLDNDSPPF